MRNRVQYRLNHDVKWRTLLILGTTFTNMDNAIGAVRGLYPFIKKVHIELALKTETGSIKEWDNF